MHLADSSFSAGRLCLCRQMFANHKLVSMAAAKEVAEAKELADAQKELGRAQAQVCPAVFLL